MRALRANALCCGSRRKGRGILAAPFFGFLLLLTVLSPIAMGEEPLKDPHNVKRDGSAFNLNFDNDGIDDYRVDADIAILHKGGWTGVQPGFNLAHRVDCVNPNPYRESQALYTHPDPEDPDWWRDEYLNDPEEDDYGCLEDAGEPLNGFTINASRGTEVDGTNGHGGVASGVRIWAVKVIEDHSINFGEYPDPDNYPIMIDGSAIGPASSPAVPVECAQSSFEARLISNSTFSLALDAEYSECVSGARAAVVEMQSCHYTLEAENAGPAYSGIWGIACDDPEDAIEIEIYNGQQLACTATVGAQQGVEGADLTNVGEKAERAIEVDAQAQDFEYQLSGSGCGTATGAFGNGELIGETTMHGTNAADQQRGVFLSGKESEVTSEKPNFNGEIGWLPDLGTAHVIAGLDWVAAHADQIDVAYFQIACAREGLVAEYPVRYEGTPECDDAALNEAIDRAIDKGVVIVAAAGNEKLDAGTVVPQANPDVFTASAVIDTDGIPGGLGSDCAIFPDDRRLDVSNFGPLVDMAAPLCGDTGGTSSKIAAAAAALASQCDPESREGVEFIIDTVMAQGHVGEIAEGGWKDDSGDGWKEPLLDLSDEEVFDPVLLHTANPALDEEPSPDGCDWKSWPARSDLDRDGRSDLVTVDSSGEAEVYAGTATGIDTTGPATSLDLDPALLDGVGDYVVDSADVTGDGRADLITMDHDGGSFVHPGKADRTFGAGVESFAATAPVYSGGTSEPIALADVTGDGLADSVSFSHQAKVIYMAPGKANGRFAESFGEGLTSSVGGLNSAVLDAAGHYFIDVVDVTGDGRADVISMDTSGTTYVFAAQANNTFAAGKAAASINPILDDGKGEEPVGLGDVDRDRRADLLTLDSGTLKLRLGRSDGTFGAATSAYSGTIDSSLADGQGEEIVGVLDYSRDGLVDLVTASNGGTVRTYTAKRDKTFASPTAYEGSIPSIRHSLGGYEFASQRPIFVRAGCTPSGCEWPPKRGVESDLDRDGRSDLITLASSGEAEVYAGTATGIDTTDPAASLDLDPALLDGVGDYLADTADVTGDGRADLITMEHDGGSFVHPGKADRTFGAGVESFKATAPVWSGLGTSEPIAVADVTGDGLADSVSFSHQAKVIYMAPGKANGSFAESFGEGLTSSLSGINSAFLDAAGHYFLDVTDVTGDKRADLVSIDTSGSAYVFVAQANNTFAAGKATAGVNPILDNGSGEEPIGLGDLSGDGRADLLTHSSSDGKLKLRLGKEDGSFATATTPYGTAIDSSLLDGTGMELIAPLDYSRDGLADLMALNSSGDILTYKAQVSGGVVTFAAPGTHAGSIESIAQGPSGSEFVAERPLLRRAGCEAGGC